MNFFDVAPWGECLPRKARRALGWGLMLGIAFSPPIQGWWLAQVDERVSDITKRIVEITISEPTTATGSGAR